MNREFILAVEELEKEKNISKDVLMDSIEVALVSAYKKNYDSSNVRVNIDRVTGDIDVYMIKDVVSDEDVMNENDEMTLDEARKINENYNIGDVVEIRVTPRDFGRIAAQIAKQVVVQKIRETERGMIYDEFSDKLSEVVSGTVQRISNETVFVNIGNTEGILAVNEQVPGEMYRVNSPLKVYIMDVRKTKKGPQVSLSRSHPGLVKRLFEIEVPEIREGIVEIKSLSREAGSRTKMAVYTDDPDVDAVGACVGPRGSRVQRVVDELGGEKIDIINWSQYPDELISSSLSPARVNSVYINEQEKAATVIVPDFQLSLAIGKEGQNVRLAARLSGWKIDIKSQTQFDEAGGLEGLGLDETVYMQGYDEDENDDYSDEEYGDIVFTDENEQYYGGDEMYDDELYGDDEPYDDESYNDESDEPYDEK